MIKRTMPDYYCSECGKRIEPNEYYYEGPQGYVICLECANY